MIRSIIVENHIVYADDETFPGLFILQNGFNYEPHVRKELERLLPSASAFLDVGANVGIHCVSAKSINPNLTVFAVEMLPNNVSMLCRTIEENGFDDVNVIPVATAETHCIIRRNDDPCNGQPSFTQDGGFNNRTPAIPIDFYRLPHVDVVKIDIEGFEYSAWQGMSRVLNDRPTIIFEFCPKHVHRSNTTPEAQLQWLFNLGYRLTVLEYTPGARRDFDSDPESILKHIKNTSGDITDIMATKR